MDPGAHQQLKTRSKDLKLQIGEMVENLISSLELRLDRAYEMSGLKKKYGLDIALLSLILGADREGWTEQEFKAELENIRADLDDDSPPEWTPEIKLPDKK